VYIRFVGFCGSWVFLGRSTEGWYLMVSDSSKVDGSCVGSSAGCEEVVASSMRDGEAEKLAGNLQGSSSSADCATSTISTSRTVDRAGASTSTRSAKSGVTKKLLNSLSAQFRRSLSSMGSARVFSENGNRGRSLSMLNRDVVESKVMQVIDRVRSSGYSEEVCQDLRNHFSRLPAR
jgi:hypothetical protein